MGRIVNLDLSNDENLIDWTHEREWRIPKELTFELSQISIIVPDAETLNEFKDYCLKNGMEIENEVASIVSLLGVLL